MRIVKIKNKAGRDLYLNADAVSYICTDLMDDKSSQVHLNLIVHIVPFPPEETIKLLQGNSK